MISKPGWLEEAIARPDGYYTEDGEKLKGANLSAEHMAEWNGTSAPAPAPEPEVEMLNEAPSSKSMDDMSKKELEALGRQHGIELDRRKSKSDLVEELNEHIEE